MKLNFFCAISLIICSIVTIGCMPIYMTNKKSFDHEIFPFKDSLTGAVIQECIIIPLYCTSNNILHKNDGHGPGPGLNTSFFAHPFKYKNGSKFETYYGTSYGVLFPIGMVWFGQNTSIYYLLVIAKGYEPKMICTSSPRTIFKYDDLLLVPLRNEEEISHELIDILIKDELLIDFEKAKFLGFSVNNYFKAFAPIEMHFTDDEKLFIKNFLEKPKG